MANLVLIIGDSGTGKSTSIRNLTPSETFVINVLDKPLPFKGARANYVKLEGSGKEHNSGNYYASDSYEAIKRILNHINGIRSDIKNIVIDDFQYLLVNEFMDKALLKGFDKFSEIAQHAHELIRICSQSMRQNLNIFFTSHIEHDVDGKTKPKTIGKMLNDKVTLEGMFTTVLHSLAEDGQYYFITQNHGKYMAKSPMGMFDSLKIDNDLNLIVEKMNEYFYEEILETIDVAEDVQENKNVLNFKEATA